VPLLAVLRPVAAAAVAALVARVAGDHGLGEIAAGALALSTYLAGALLLEPALLGDLRALREQAAGAASDGGAAHGAEP
jgi:hypothetical protein